MLDYLLDPRFIVQNLLALIAIGVSVYVFRNQRTFKELTYNLVGIRLFDVGLFGDYEMKFRVLYEGEEVDNMRHLVVRFQHSGTEPIRPDDYEGPLVVAFGHEARVYQCDVAAKHPEELNVSTKIDGGTVALGSLYRTLATGFGSECWLRTRMRQPLYTSV
jgi:hypothetical protein